MTYQELLDFVEAQYQGADDPYGYHEGRGVHSLLSAFAEAYGANSLVPVQVLEQFGPVK